MKTLNTKTIMFTITATLEIDEDMVYDKAGLRDEILGHFVKIKSGLYDNAACGYVTDVIIADNTEEKS